MTEGKSNLTLIDGINEKMIAVPQQLFSYGSVPGASFLSVPSGASYSYDLMQTYY